MARGINKRVIYLFVLTRNLKSEDPEDLINVEPLTIENAYDYLNPESYKICNSYGGKFGDGECFFKKALTNCQVAEFVQKLRDSMDTKLYFAVKQNGIIWHVDKTGEENKINTPYGVMSF
jgi:hypothetical protein